MFVAVFPPEVVRQSWEELVEPRRDTDPEMRFVASQTWHVTLAFLADVPDALEERVIDALTEVAVRQQAFDLGVEGAGAFPNPAAAKFLWLGVSAGAEPLGSLARKTRTAVERVGVRCDGSPFRPHLTLARTRRAHDITRWLRIVEAFPGYSWPVSEMVLVQSRLTPSGPIHTPVAALPFGRGSGMDRAGLRRPLT
jgi:2'-5' RNA ligase